MTGTGTQADPYVVSTWAEFASVCNISLSTYIVWEDGETDFNDVQPEGFTAKIQITGNITLRRCIFRNAAFRQTDWVFQLDAGSDGILFDECKILDVEHYVKAASNKGFINCNSRTITFDKCELSYWGESGNNYGTEYFCYQNSSNNTKATFNRCSIKFKYSSSYNNSDFIITNRNYSNFTYCFVDLNVSCPKMNGLFPGLICWYSGSIALTQNCSASSSGSPGSIVVDVECSHTITYTGSAYNYMILYNSEKATLNGDRVVGVTTAQLQDTEYLAGIGFPAREGGNGS